ncbi:MAG TPA: protein kinase [Nitrososphaeria archaeon]|nr:protein kinase [Nitrososphaeria archaeon]
MPGGDSYISPPIGNYPWETLKKVAVEEIPSLWKGIEVKPLPEDYHVLEEYSIREDLAKVVIASPPGSTLEPMYFVIEVPLSPEEIKILEQLKDILSKELEPPKAGEEEDAKRVLIETADKLLRKYGKGLGTIDEDSKRKLFYYLERDMTGFGPLNVIMEDYRIEDISCDGVRVPIYVWHRDYESMPTNIMFTDRDALDDYIIQLAHKSEKHISSAFPILDAMIYGKHRLAATFREEVSPKGSTFTIRKFREKPFSITELLRSNLLNPEMAAYFWLLIEHKANILIAGATGSGKTTILNALACFIRPRMKIVTCEETAELNIPSENWVRFVTRESYGLGSLKTGEITLFDLVRTSLRYRPDYLVVGEVRGEEAFVLFQAIATGHGGLSTIHAESIESVMKRLVSPPMNIPPSHIPLLDAVALVERVSLPRAFMGKTFGRRIRYIWEVVDYGRYVTIAEWDPLNDTFKVDFSNSVVLEKIAFKLGKPREYVIEEIKRRALILERMVDNDIIDLKDVAKIIYAYYSNPEQILSQYEISIQRREAEVMEEVAVESVSSGPSTGGSEEEAAAEILKLLRASNGACPLWRIYVGSFPSKIAVLNALKKLKDEGRVEIAHGIVKLLE